MTADLADRLNALPPSGLSDRLLAITSARRGRIVFTTSFGLEDQVITEAVVRSGVAIDIVTLDNGRLFAETYEVWAETERRLGIRIRALHPDAGALEALHVAQGPNGFYDSRAAREACCGVRKVAPLARALDGAAGWVTGLRVGQSGARANVPFVAWDATRGLLKANPLFDWTSETVALQVRSLEIPYNALHDRGFPSIGCAPCTRPVRVGEDARAGRWWWEQSARECGLHVALAACPPKEHHVRNARQDTVTATVVRPRVASQRWVCTPGGILGARGPCCGPRNMASCRWTPVARTDVAPAYRRGATVDRLCRPGDPPRRHGPTGR